MEINSVNIFYLVGVAETLFLPHRSNRRYCLTSLQKRVLEVKSYPQNYFYLAGFWNAGATQTTQKILFDKSTEEGS